MKFVGLVTAMLCIVLWTGSAAASNVALQAAISKKSTRVQAPAKAVDKPVALSEEQLAVAPRVATGVLPCELAQKVSVQAHPEHAGHFAVESGKQRFVMVPVATSTGAIRLEDAARGAVWLQLANKSMLMDQRQGRRLADACMSAEQQAVALAMEKNPAPHLLEPLPVPQDGTAMK
ncbi:hypothetical protein [Rhodoferax mekongensis]|uniref:Uncharacterized protein n=1 Tax=Rhodoferax mekongensis TaxID=3068341 RepID=A0ABZ0B437_9BURK|nr:hypothetical protein [Rhodoferax sp. TBRC 17307]WNO06567.1 hypothetical protein RAN89_09105 [Rhodoferax sp. TBRC 17307]